MKVSQLIAMLKSQPGEAEVWCEVPVGYGSRVDVVGINGMFHIQDDRGGEVVVLQSRQ
jgi:hypothetical protein